METSSHYVVLVDGQPLRLHAEHNGSDRYACGEHTHTLVAAGDWRYGEAAEFRLADERAVKRFLHQGSVAWYNSDPERPNWGGLTRARMSFAKVTVAVTVEPVAILLPEPVKLGALLPDYLTRDALGPLRRRYGLEDGDLAIYVAAGPDGAFALPMAELEARLRGKDIRHGDRLCTLITVAQPDEHYYYAFLRVVDDQLFA